jgi:hypothetical protein
LIIWFRKTSVGHLIDADFSFLNQRLAQHYDIEGVISQQMRKVSFGPQAPRGGLLTMGSVLADLSMVMFTNVSVPAGSVLVMDSRLWHATARNRSSDPRAALAVRDAPHGWINRAVLHAESEDRKRMCDEAGRTDSVVPRSARRCLLHCGLKFSNSIATGLTRNDTKFRHDETSDGNRNQSGKSET